MPKTIKIETTTDLPLYSDFYESSAGLQPLIVFVHGFKGFKNWGGFPYMLDKISESGFKLAALNFTCNGVDENNPLEFSKLDLFARNTLSRELQELGFVIDHFYEYAGTFNIDKKRIALIGHSRGGGTSIIKASTDKRIRCLITLASVSHFDRYSDKLKGEWRKKGYIEVENTRTKQMMRMNVTLLEDLETNKTNLNILSAASNLNIPSLFVHGKEDLAVRYDEAEELYENSNKKMTELFLLENTGHTFGVTHPFAGSTPAFERVIMKTVDFLKSHL